ncbi:MAG: hypothetical protein LC649_09690 [Bacteroidales bacterium]|nr:hypothetical protein [Bacteroidales bacterium]
MNFTDNALNQFKKLIDQSNNPKAGIRFYTVQGCCSPSLQMGTEENPAKDDLVIQMSGVDIFVTPDAEKILSNITIDYTKDGFRTVKPSTDNQTGGCC